MKVIENINFFKGRGCLNEQGSVSGTSGSKDSY